MKLDIKSVLPEDEKAALLIGRAWLPGPLAGPSLVCIHEGQVHDLSRVAPTCSELLNSDAPAAAVRSALRNGSASVIASLEDALQNSAAGSAGPHRAHFLTPIDLQAVRACGVTYVASMLERVIEEQAKGDPQQAEELRHAIGEEIGAELRNIKPGSPQAMRVKESLIKRKLWSQYLEVGIGPDAEVFNKAQPLSAVGIGAEVGILSNSSWNNPEPELVLVINRRGQIVGATLGNDVNLRDWEGRSALLLGRAKDNNASCAIGPFVRLLDDTYTLDDMRRTQITTQITGSDGFRVEGTYSVSQISRDPADLASQAINRNHQYPDGLALFLGTAFAPTQDRGEPGKGFTHHPGDIVSIRSPRLGALINRVNLCDQIPEWSFGIADLMRNLSARGLI
ncbi:MAG: fumarylacetoacetate hydrolase [Betaproteobacteria bacterium]|nr:fumarylacetoacetate hydrolase [Betaproteobacteria bacterium]